MKTENIIIIFSLLAAIAVVFFLIVPAFDSIGNVKLAAKENQAKLAEVEDFYDRMIKLREEYQAKPETVQEATTSLPDGQNLEKLLTQLETLASASGLVMQSVDFNELKPSVAVGVSLVVEESEDILPTKSAGTLNLSAGEQAAAQKPYKTLQIDLKLNGGQDSFKNYLQALEGNERLLDVISFSLVRNLSGGAFSEGQNVSAFTVKTNAYYQ